MSLLLPMGRGRQLWSKALPWILSGLAAVTAVWLILAFFPSVEAVAAVIALLGTLVTAVVTHLIERTNDKRLRLDAAMRAGTLLSPGKDERGVSSAAAASGLLALTELGRSDLAVALLVDLWPLASERNGAPPAVTVPDEVAVLVVNAALLGGATQPSAPLVAAELLCRHARELEACGALHWPSALDGGWIQTLSPRAKCLIIEALVKMTIAVNPATPNALRCFAVRIYGIYRGETDSYIKGCVGRLIKAVIEPLGSEKKYCTFMQGSMVVRYEQLRDAADRKFEDNPDHFLAKLTEERSEELHRWAAGLLTEPVTSDGALSHGMSAAPRPR